MHLNKDFWSKRYRMEETGWDTGRITTPLKVYIDQLENKSLNILIPGCGHGYEAEYLFQNGFKNVSLLDISSVPLESFHQRVPEFPSELLINKDFFELGGSWDLILEQTFFCAIHPSLRKDYAMHCKNILNPGGKLVGVLFDDLLFDDRPPFGGSEKEYLTYFEPFFEINVFERCFNSIKPRKDRELFINLVKKKNQT